jgi:anti-sigma B factor antagonist
MTMHSWIRTLFARQPRNSRPAPAHPTPASEGSTPGLPGRGAAAAVAAAAPCPQPTAALVVRFTKVGEAVVVNLAGEAGTDNLRPLELALARVLARRVPLVVINCSGLTLLSSLAMGLLVGLRRRLGRWQGCVKLAGVGPQIEQALRAVRLTDLFEVYANDEQALATAAGIDEPFSAMTIMSLLVLEQE